MPTLTSPVLDDILTNVRNMLGQPSSLNSFWTDEELIAYLNEAIRKFFAEVVPLQEGQFTTQVDLNITAGVQLVALPSDFFSCKILFKAVNTGYIALSYLNNLNQDYMTLGQAGNSYEPQYAFQGNNLQLHPVPTASETNGLRLEYVQFPSTMLTGGDSLTSQVSPIFRDLIEGYMVFKAKLKESMTNGTNTYGPAKENLAELYQSFKDAIVKRSHYPTYVQPFNPEIM